MPKGDERSESPAKKVKIRRGLRNDVKNTCYLNSALQLLAKPVSQYFKSRMDKLDRDGGAKRPLTMRQKFKSLLHRLRTPGETLDATPYAEEYARHAAELESDSTSRGRFVEGQQQDPSEFIVRQLQELAEQEQDVEMEDAGPPMDDIFETLVSVKVCHPTFRDL